MSVSQLSHRPNEGKLLLALMLFSVLAAAMVQWAIPVPEWIWPGLLWGLAAAFGLGWLGLQWAKDITWRWWVVHLAWAVALCLGYHQWHCGIMVDDAGFILRYLRQTSSGCWYCFNHSEGPVFGISSFSHGVLTLSLHQLGIARGENSLLASNVVGLLAIGVLIQRLLALMLPWKGLGLVLSMLVMAGAKSFMFIAATGMETPLHLAIVLGALVAFAHGSGRTFWLLLALAVVSKLDAVPLALAWGALWLMRERKSLLVLRRNPLITALCWCGPPLAIWLTFSTWYFGSPLPLSAASKLHLHHNPLQHWFPFAQRYLEGEFLRWLLLAFGALMVAHVVLVLRRPGMSIAGLLPGVGFLAVMALYYFYNPKERMEWYYALPDMMLVLQVTLSASVLAQAALLGRRLAWLLPAVMVVPGMAMLDAAHGMSFFRSHLRQVESERQDIGMAMGRRLQPTDTLLTLGGMAGAFTDAFVVDLSALNSRKAQQYETLLEKALPDARPTVAVVEAFSYWTSPFEGLPYHLDSAGYQICETGMAPWFVLVRDAQAGPFHFQPIQESEIAQAVRTSLDGGVLRVEGTRPAFSVQTWISQDVRLVSGVRRKARPWLLHVDEYQGDTLVHSHQVEVPALVSTPRREESWTGISIPLQKTWGQPIHFRIWSSLGDSVCLMQPALATP